ncbi:MAG: HAMP domain-containing sensor histidine kinase [Lachnospiraceae bacterium]|nr:HAMP domain-containing sensor histidine kinase [Lachnospiraceae bacterium]
MMEKTREVLSKLLRSLKLRIFLIILIAGIIPSIVLKNGIVRNYENRAVSVRQSDVQAQLKILANHLITYSYLQDTSSDVINAELEQLSSLYDGRVMIINSNFKIIKDTYGISEGKTIISEEIIRCFKTGESMSNYDRDDGYIEMTTPIMETVGSSNIVKMESTEAPSIVGVMLISVSADYVTATMEILNRTALLLEIVMVVIIFGMSVYLSTMLVRPFNRITEAINNVKEGYTDQPIQVSDYVETEHITDSFNRMLERMRALNDSRQEFVSNVSHELKTPLTSMKVLADSLMADENAPVEMYREFMGDIASEIDRENSIINDLLS